MSDPNLDLEFMALALEQAKIAQSINEIPVGCVIVDEQNQVISTGYNQTITTHDPTAHAEMVALRKAGLVLENYRLVNLRLYVTLEPCSMCASAMIHARIKKVYFGAYDYKTGACGSALDFLNEPCHNHHVESQGGILQEPCSAILSNFFTRRRLEKKQLATKTLSTK